MRPRSSALTSRLFVAFIFLCLMGEAARCAEVIVEEDISYGKAGDTELKLDLARPQGDGPFPAIVFIHGGGWSGGSRQGYRGEIQEAAKRGYVAATISYRLMKYDEAKKETTTATPIFPAQIHAGYTLSYCCSRWIRNPLTNLSTAFQSVYSWFLDVSVSLPASLAIFFIIHRLRKP